MEHKLQVMKLKIINGPNLNLLGIREPEIYGKLSFDEYIQTIKNEFSDVTISYFQSNIEGEIINSIQECYKEVDGIIINAGGYSHTSVSIADALKAVNIPYIEIHISNVFAREEYRHHSILATHAIGVITGFGLEGYKMAVKYFTENYQV